MGPWAGTTGPDDARRPQTTGPLRFVRGACVGSSAVVLGAGGHALASGMTPATSSLLVASVVAVLVGIVMSGRRWRLPSLIAVLAAAQVAFHVLLGGTHAMAGMAGPTGGDPHPVLMVLAHALAVVVSAMLLERGEDWCWQLVELLTRPLRVTRLVPVVAHAELRVINEWTSSVGRRQAWLASQQHRGPPGPAVA